MPLGKFVQAAKAKQITSPPLVVDLSRALGEGAKVQFRPPETADFFPSDATRLRFVATYPTLLELEKRILIMAACYVPDQGEKEVSPVDELAQLALTGRDVFMYLASEFNNAFTVEDFSALVDAAKNA